jgi:hypothetical protein
LSSFEGSGDLVVELEDAALQAPHQGSGSNTRATWLPSTDAFQVVLSWACVG